MILDKAFPFAQTTFRAMRCVSIMTTEEGENGRHSMPQHSQPSPQSLRLNELSTSPPGCHKTQKFCGY